MADLEQQKFNLVVDVMKKGGYTLSALTDFLIKGLGNVSKAGVSHEDLRPDASLVQVQVLEALSSLYKTSRPKRQPLSPRGSKRAKPKAKASPETVSVSIPQTPQSEVVAQLSKKKQEIADTPSMVVSSALGRPAAKSMPRGKKRKVLASEVDELAEEFATRLNLGNESKGPSPKRLRCNTSLPSKVCFIIPRRERETAKVWKLANAINKARTSQLEKTTSSRKRGDAGKKAPQQQQQRPPPPPQQQQQQQQWEAAVQLRKRKREATIAQARARREILR
ncbi:hypothetical protein MMC22_006711 [Lobaria immixta]|nr:hypothetical protein [Lobaria immixta]